MFCAAPPRLEAASQNQRETVPIDQNTRRGSLGGKNPLLVHAAWNAACTFLSVYAVQAENRALAHTSTSRACGPIWLGHWLLRIGRGPIGPWGDAPPVCGSVHTCTDRPLAVPGQTSAKALKSVRWEKTPQADRLSLRKATENVRTQRPVILRHSVPPLRTATNIVDFAGNACFPRCREQKKSRPRGGYATSL